MSARMQISNMPWAIWVLVTVVLMSVVRTIGLPGKTQVASYLTTKIMMQFSRTETCWKKIEYCYHDFVAQHGNNLQVQNHRCSVCLPRESQLRAQNRRP